MDIFYNLKDVNINGYYRMYLKDENDKEQTINVLIKYVDGYFFDGTTSEKWSFEETQNIKLNMHLYNDNYPNSCYVKLIKNIE